MLFEPILDHRVLYPVIKIIGVGGCGGNVLTRIVNDSAGIDFCYCNVEFAYVDTDRQALRKSVVRDTVQIGANLTKGLGSGEPNIGFHVAEEERDTLVNMLEGVNIAFIVAGMGGGTATGAAPVIAEIAKEKGVFTVGVVTKPFRVEGRRRSGYAEQGIRDLARHVDLSIFIEQDSLIKDLKDLTVQEAFALINARLSHIVLGITQPLGTETLVGVEFADIAYVIPRMKNALVSIGKAGGNDRAMQAVQSAVHLFQKDDGLVDMDGIIVSIVSNGDISECEVTEIMNYIDDIAASTTPFLIGTAEDSSLSGQIRVIIIAGEVALPETGILKGSG